MGNEDLYSYLNPNGALWESMGRVRILYKTYNTISDLCRFLQINTDLDELIGTEGLIINPSKSVLIRINSY